MLTEFKICCLKIIQLHAPLVMKKRDEDLFLLWARKIAVSKDQRWPGMLSVIMAESNAKRDLQNEDEIIRTSLKENLRKLPFVTQQRKQFGIKISECLAQVRLHFRVILSCVSQG